MPVQITINGENANQAIEEFAALSAAFAGQAPVTATVEPPQQLTSPAAQPSHPQQPAQHPQQGYGAPAVPVAQSQPTPSAPPAQPVGAVPTTAPTYDLTQLGVAAQPIMDAGRQNEIIAWLNQHGVQALTQLNPGLYGEFATFLRSLGAKI